MSIRTVIEINHDYLGQFTPETWRQLVEALKAGDHSMFNSKPELRGLKFLLQRHHSTKATVTLE